MSCENLPVLILNKMTMFPSIDVRIDFNKEEEKKLVEVSEKYFKGKVVLVSKEDPLEENPDLKELLKIGVLAQITTKMQLPNGAVRVTFHGIKRLEIEKYYQEEGILHAKTKVLLTEEVNPKEEVAYLQGIKNTFRKLSENNPEFSMNQIFYINDLDTLTDILSFSFPLSEDRKQEYLLEPHQVKRAEMLISDFRNYLEIKKLEEKITGIVEANLAEEQKKYVLREKLKVIKEELGENYNVDTRILEFRQKLEKLECKEEIKERLEKEMNRLEHMPPLHPESAIVENYIELMLSLPWSKKTTDEKDFKKVEAVLSENHYGLTEIKDRILEYLALRERTNQKEGSILCFVGPPGVGKTTLAQSIAKALNKQLAKISVGGVQDEADIVGHRKTYIGAMPGMIIEGMKKAGVKNPLFLIDEIDKMTKSIHGDPASSLLEALDKEQNSAFVDHYIEEPFDLSEVFFVTTANYIDQIPPELLDRLEVIELSSYTEYEKLKILKKHIIPKTIESYHLKEEKIDIKDDVLLYMIRNYTKEAGVREIERLIQKIFRKYIKNLMSDKKAKFSLTKKNISSYLGKELYQTDSKTVEKQVGVVNGLSYTPYGGDTLKIEATMYEGCGNLILTGSLGEVMKESAEVCMSYIKANAKRFGISKDVLKNNDFHIHAEEGAVKKEGPSAGVSLTTVLLSLLTNTKIPGNVAMTGEMTLRGNILPIGGVREKIIGAHKENITKVFLPAFNKRDLDEIPDSVKEKIKFVFVKDYDDIYKDLFVVLKKQDESWKEKLIQLEL